MLNITLHHQHDLNSNTNKLSALATPLLNLQIQKAFNRYDEKIETWIPAPMLWFKIEAIYPPPKL